MPAKGTEGETMNQPRDRNGRFAKKTKRDEVKYLDTILAILIALIIIGSIGMLIGFDLSAKDLGQKVNASYAAGKEAGVDVGFAEGFAKGQSFWNWSDCDPIYWWYSSDDLRLVCNNDDRNWIRIVDEKYNIKREFGRDPPSCPAINWTLPPFETLRQTAYG